MKKIGIIGGSIAGLESAIQLADRYEVVVYEEHPEIGTPVQCGEGWVHHHNIEPYGGVIREVDRAIIRRIDFNNFSVKDQVELILDGIISIIDRSVMEKNMAKIAEENGATILTERKVSISEILYDHDIIVDASGHPSQWSREFGRHKKGGVAIQVYAKYDADEIVLDIPKETDGYFWIFPKEEGYANIGVGYGRKKIKMKQSLMRYLDHIGAEPVRWTGGSLGVFMDSPFVKNVLDVPVVLVGDAAGLVDPFFGEGMTKAILSSRIFAKNLKQGTLHRYEKEYLSFSRWHYISSWLLYLWRSTSTWTLFKTIKWILPLFYQSQFKNARKLTIA